jgi:hypothetical protein
MVPFFQLFSLGWLLAAAGCCAAEAAEWRSGVSSRRQRMVKKQRLEGTATKNHSLCGREKYMLRERRNGAGEKTAAVLAVSAALQKSPRNLSTLRPPQGRQVAVLGTGFNARRNVRCLCRPSQAGPVMPACPATAGEEMKRNGHKKHEKTQKG